MSTFAPIPVMTLEEATAIHAEYGEKYAPGTVFIVAVYDVDMAYGGPAEGGWYYIRGSLVRQVKQFRSRPQAMIYCQRLNRRLDSRKFGPNFGKRELSSVLSDGEFQAEIHENRCPEFYPERKPHYE
jgi:hypothetical protein